MVCPNLFCG